MSSLRTLSLKTKLIGGFTLVAVLTAVVGGIGWWALRELRSDLKTVTDNCLPSVQRLLQVQVAAERGKTARRTFMNLNLSLEDFQRQAAREKAAEETAQAALKAFSGMVKGGEETALFERLTTAWNGWQEANNEFYDKAAALRKLLESCVTPDRPNPDHYLNTVLDGRSLAQEALIDLKKQVGSWKNLLLRGNTEADFAKYTAEFDGFDANIRKDLATLKSLARQLNSDSQTVDDAEKKYSDLLVKYRDLRQHFDRTDPFAGKKVDTLARGCDQAATAAVETIRTDFEARGNAVRAIGDALDRAAKACVSREEAAFSALEKLTQTNLAQAAAETEHAEATYRSGVWWAAVATATGFAVAIGAGLLLAISITRALFKGVEFARHMAEGDLSHTLHVSARDEIGQLAEALNHMAANLRRMFSGISQNTQTLAGASTELSTTATQLASGAEETTRQSAHVASAAEEMSANMTTMAASTEQMAANVKTVAAAVEELTASIGEVARSAEQAAGVAGQAAGLVTASNTQIGDLSNAADQIGKVIEVIQDIAEQTKLLALNATIEAARAGEAGKGFAVVATEVKELARQTASATDDIRKRIEHIQGSTGQTIQSMSQIGDVIGRVNDLSRTIASAVEEQSITTKEIARSVAETASVAQTVTRSIGESATASREIAQNIAGVDQAAKESAQGAVHTQTTGRDLTQVAEQLSTAVGQFKL